MNAFTEGLKLAPDDPTLLAELGLAALGAAARAPPHCGTNLDVTSATVTENRIQSEYRSFNGCQHDGDGHTRTWGWDENGLVVAGVGPLGNPAAMPPIPTKVVEWISTIRTAERRLPTSP